MLITVGVFVLLFAVTAKLYKFFLGDYSRMLDPTIPGPKRRGWLGIATDLSISNHYAPHIRWSRQYGKLYSFVLLGHPSIGVADPALAEQVLCHPACTERPDDVYASLRSFLGKHSLLTINGEEWRKARRMLSKTFHSQNMKNFLSIYNSSGRILADVVKQREGPESFDFCTYTLRVTVDIVVQSMFREDLNLQRDHSHPIPQALKLIADEYGERAFSLVRKFNPAASWRFFRANQYLRRVIGEIITRHRAQPHTHDERDLVDLMLEARDESGVGLSDEEIYSQCLTFFFAGHDTTAHTLAWCVHEIACHPEVERRVLAEVDAVLTDRKADLEWTDLPKLKYINCVVKEVLRLHPPAPLFLREASADFELDGHLVRRGTLLDVHAHAIQMNEQVFPDAMTFNPDRFRDEENLKRHPYAFLAFSARERQCIGMTFGMLELKALIALLYKQVVFRQDRLDMPMTMAKVTQLPNQVTVFVYARDGPFAKVVPHVALPQPKEFGEAPPSPPTAECKH
eukprot:TRINITY_DN12143_c0_g1_i1.p1 TRINITY_DN12143_c0_g1~~TRINITY_DN12143_c0_g1_i1.p1  ORF type:complete len:513 (+),score=77.04 TRINITY_DN12143_c0_g1_i1:1649-3187(+)